MKAKMPMLLVQIDPNFVSLNLYENNQLTFSRFASIDPVDYDNSEDYIYEAVTENISPGTFCSKSEYLKYLFDVF